MNDDNDNNIKRKSALSSLIAGLGSGLITCILCAPLDCIKVRIQVQGQLINKKHAYNGIIGSFNKIIKEEGIRGLYRGLTPSLLTVPLFNAIYWSSYDHLKQCLEQDFPNMPIQLIHVMSAIVAGGIGDVITNPFFVTRVRMQTLILHNNNSGIDNNISTTDMMKKIYNNEGLGAFYKGLGASFLGLSHVAIQFPLYEYLKKNARDNNDNNKETVIDLICASISAKLVACLLTYPHEVIRSRLQDRKTPKGVINLVKGMVNNEGFLSLWSGLRVNLVRTFPATICTFLSYEYISRHLQ